MLKHSIRAADAEQILSQMQEIVDLGSDLADELEGLDPDDPDDVARAAQLFDEADRLNEALNSLADEYDRLADDTAYGRGSAFKASAAELLIAVWLGHWIGKKFREWTDRHGLTPSWAQ